jgi:exodeoxyribonuclease VIII
MHAIHINIIEVIMTIGLKKFGGRFEPKKSALEKDSTLPVYVAFKQAKNKTIAKTLLHADFIQFAPDYADDYFAPKVWEVEEEMFCTVEGQFYTDLFTGEIVWNAEKGEPERIIVEPELAGGNEQLNADATEEKMKPVKELDVLARAYCLAVFGAIEEITPSQYGQLIDMLNDDEFSPLREQAEGLAKEPRILAMLPEKQTECLVWVRQKARDNAKWPDYKNLFTQWADTPPDKREPVKCVQTGTTSSDKPTMSELATRLRYRTAMGKLSRSMDFDVCSPPVGIEMRINTMLCSKDVEIDDWCAPFSRTPGIHDYHPASIVAIIKTADEKIHIYPGELRQYIDSCIAGFDCVNPPQLVIDIACGRTSAPLPQKKDGAKSDGVTEQTLQDENLPPAVCPARAAELDRELDAAFANSASNEGEKTEVTEQEDDRPLLDDHEIEIAHALNDLLSGRTDLMGKEEAEGVVACTGHIITDILPLLIIDIATTEFCLSPNFSDEEVHDVATTILDSWSDDAAVRQKIALDAIVEYRRPQPPKPVVMDPPVVTVKPKKEPETVIAPKPAPIALTYRQQLTLAALQGMCANPAYRGDFDELPHMAAALAAGVISAEAEQ